MRHNAAEAIPVPDQNDQPHQKKRRLESVPLQPTDFGKAPTAETQATLDEIKPLSKTYDTAGPETREALNEMKHHLAKREEEAYWQKRDAEETANAQHAEVLASAASAERKKNINVGEDLSKARMRSVQNPEDLTAYAKLEPEDLGTREGIYRARDKERFTQAYNEQGRIGAQKAIEREHHKQAELAHAAVQELLDEEADEKKDMFGSGGSTDISQQPVAKPSSWLGRVGRWLRGK